MGRYRLTDFAVAELRSMHPDDRDLVVRVLDILGKDTGLRDSSKFGVDLPPEQGEQVWGIRMGRVWVAFTEENGNDISIIHLTMLSRFRYDDK
jgi:hypothetical protein